MRTVLTSLLLSGLLWPGLPLADGSADGWLPLHGLSGSSQTREIFAGLQLNDLDADLDPMLGKPGAQSSLTVQGTLGGQSGLLLGLGQPWGEGRWSVALRVHGEQRDQVRFQTRAQDETLGNGDPDLLRWSRLAIRDEPAHQALDAGLRLGLRTPGWGLGVSARMQRRVDDLTRTHFAFPATGFALNASAESMDVFDLRSGERIARTAGRLDGALEHSTLDVGLDLGFGLSALQLGFGGGWQRNTRLDRVDSNRERNIAGSHQWLQAERDLAQTEDWLRLAARLDGGAQAGEGWRGSLGLGMQQLLGTARSGSESLSERRTAGLRVVTDEWIRQHRPETDSGWTLEARAGGGYTGHSERFVWSGGALARIVLGNRQGSWADELVRRVDDPGAPGQIPAGFLRAAGEGLWESQHEWMEWAVLATAGARHTLTGRLDLMAGARVGWAGLREDLQLRLVETTAIAGERSTEDQVVDPVALPYSNFDVVTGQQRLNAGILADLALGLALADERFSLSGLLRLDGLDWVSIGLEGAVRW